MNSHRMQEKQIKTLFENSVEKELLFAKHVIFMAEVSHQFHLPKHVKPKVLKHLLSVFRDWKSHSWGSRELSRENLCIPLASGPSTREQVAKIYLRAHDCGMRIDWPVTKSPKQGNTVFWNFQFLREQNTFQKQLKHSKIFLCLNQQRLSMWKHILSSTITQMNMVFIGQNLVCCMWISTMR